MKPRNRFWTQTRLLRTGIFALRAHSYTQMTKVFCLFFLFQVALVADAKNIYYLHQTDFDNGTFQITAPGVYRLAENISFNPHPVGSTGERGQVLDAYTAGRPFYSQYGYDDPEKYDPGAYGIGFFAAIAISANDIVLDLNGFTIEQSEAHALLQRFFSVIELADRPFLSGQGPHDFGSLVPATNVVIKNGVIGRSSHHGIHGNNNRNVVIKNVDFEDFEVAAVALNGVRGMRIVNSVARSREDVPVIGTYSNALFISTYINWLVSTGSTTTLNVQGDEFTAEMIQQALRASINNVYEDVILNGFGVIDMSQHALEYGLYHNEPGVVDGNAYGYLVNKKGVAVGGFPRYPANESSKYISLRNVRIERLRASVNEVIAINKNQKPVTDPVGAIFMVKNTHPDTGEPLTVSSLSDSLATYTGNPLANAQLLVAKAALNGEFDQSPLDISRLNITPDIIDWVEQGTVLSSVVTLPSDYFCNGDTMFHVNKGVIGFKIDGAKFVSLRRVHALNIENEGLQGSTLCGTYSKSHPDATLPGYGGGEARGFSIAGSKFVWIKNSIAQDVFSFGGNAIGFDVLTDSRYIVIKNSAVIGLNAGSGYIDETGPGSPPEALGVLIRQNVGRVRLKRLYTDELEGYDGESAIRDLRP